MAVDPERHVDEFSRRVEEWREWYNNWIECGAEGRGVPDDHFFLPRSNKTDKFLREAAEIMTLQNQVNIMLLAKIDELEKRIAGQ